MKKIFLNILIIVYIMGLNSSCSKGGIEPAPEFPPMQPQAVQNFTAVGGDAEVTLTWESVDPENTTAFELTYTPSGEAPIVIAKKEKSYKVTSLTNNTEYVFVLKAKNGDIVSESVTAKATPQKVEQIGQILSFAFMAENNSNMALDPTDVVDIIAPAIDHEAKTVTFDAAKVSAYIYTNQLVPQFKVTEGAVVTIDGVTQKSGETTVDFTKDVQYTLTIGNDATVYTVKVNKNNFAVIPDNVFREALKAKGLPFNEQDELNINSEQVIDYASESKLNIDLQKSDKKIANIKGIEFFVNAKEIDAEGNTFTTIDVSKNEGLRNLVIGINSELENIKIGNKNNLEIVYLSAAPKLTEKVIQPIITANKNIKRLYIQAIGSKIGKIDLTNSTSIERLRLNSSTAQASATSINEILKNNSNNVDLRIYNDETGKQCTNYNKETYICE